MAEPVKSGTISQIYLKKDDKYYDVCDARTRKEVDGLLDKIYPIGSIYMSMNDTSPNILFGGEWTKIQGRFLYATSENGASNQSGGASQVTLTDNQVPLRNHNHSLSNHTHQINGHSHSLSNHTHQINGHSHSLSNHTHSIERHSHSVTMNLYHNHDCGFHSDYVGQIWRASTIIDDAGLISHDMGGYLFNWPPQVAIVGLDPHGGNAEGLNPEGFRIKPAGGYTTVTSSERALTTNGPSTNSTGEKALTTNGPTTNKTDEKALTTNGPSTNVTSDKSLAVTESVNILPPYLTVHMWQRTA